MLYHRIDTLQTTVSSIPSLFLYFSVFCIDYNGALSVKRLSWVALPGVQAREAAVRCKRWESKDPLRNRQVVLGEASRANE